MRRGRLILGEYRALEEALWAEIERLQGDDSLARITVVAPSRSLVRHLKVRALARFGGGLFGVRLANLSQLVLDLAGNAASSYVAGPVIYERFLLEWLESLDPDDCPFPTTQACTYDFAGALSAAVRDLRDAAVPSDPQLIVERLRAAAREDGTRLSVADVRKLAAVLRVYRHYTDTLPAAGVLDRAEVYRVAAGNAASLADAVLVYGFYDMTQVQADFVAELARHTPLTLFVPFGVPAETWKFGEWFRNTFAPGVTSKTVLLPAEPPPPTPEIHSARGEEGEVWFCAKEIRSLLDARCPAAQIAVVARTLDPYLRHVEELFRQHSIPYEGQSSRLLLHHPLAQMIRLCFRAGLDGFPRSAVMDILRHPVFRAPDDRRHWDLLARALRIKGGSDWIRLQGYAETGYRSFAFGPEEEGRAVPVFSKEVATLRQAVSTLTGRKWHDQAGWADHAEAHRAALDDFIRFDCLSEEETTVLDTVRDVLATLASLDRMCVPVSRQSFIDAFERECQRRSLENPAVRGVAVLDAMAVRGLSFRHVFLLGMNARVFPRFIIEEPFISDAVRREVFRVLGHHLAVRMDGYDEERLLFHLVRVSSSERLACVYQRADAKGRLRDPSPFLRPFLPLDRGETDAIPHPEPARNARAAVQTPRERILAAHNAERALAAFGYDAHLYARGLAFIREIDQTQQIGECEGHTGRLDKHWERCSREGFSATQLELFALCPFRYFARHVLEIPTVDEQGGDDDLTPLEIGHLTHAILERLYRTWAENVFSGRELPALVERAAAEACREFEEREGTVMRGLLAVRQRQIIRAVEAFSVWDIAHLGEWEPSWFEEAGDAEVAGVSIRAKIDRIDRHRATGQLRVIEYKRRFGSPWRTKLDTLARRGQKLQGPLYMEVAPAVAARHGDRDATVAEVVFHFVENYAQEDPHLPSIHGRRMQVGLPADRWMASRRHVENAITTFVQMIRGGWFFPRPEDRPGGHCTWCDFAAVCRKEYGGLRRKVQPDRTVTLRPYWDIVQGND